MSSNLSSELLDDIIVIDLRDVVLDIAEAIHELVQGLLLRLLTMEEVIFCVGVNVCTLEVSSE